MEPQLYIQYHKTGKGKNIGYPDNDPDINTPINLIKFDGSTRHKRWIFSNKKWLSKDNSFSKNNSFCFLVVGKTEKSKMEYFLWSFFRIEKIETDQTFGYGIYGTGFNFPQPILLNGLQYFNDFSKKEYKNFGLGFFNITKYPFSKVLYSLSPSIENFVQLPHINSINQISAFNGLDIGQSWQMILSQAKKAFLSNETWQSPKQKRTYKIKKFPETNITISRDGKHEDSEFGERYVSERIKQINSANGRLSRLDWGGHVAKMAAIVHLHPQLIWDENFDTIIVVDLLKTIYQGYGEAPNDDPYELQTFAKKVRRGQKMFRDILMTAYQGKCCITESDVEILLDACHIQSHATNGNNKSENGLLLRTDIHELFDAGFLEIDPDNFIVSIHPQMKKSEYWIYNGKKLLDRVDGKRPSQYFLSERWKNKKW